MQHKIIILLCCIFLFAKLSIGKFSGRDSLWEKLTYINDSLKSSSTDKLQVLLKIESDGKQSPRPDSLYTFLLIGIGKLYFLQGDYLKASQYYWKSIHTINSNAKKPWINPDQAVMGYFKLHVVYDSLNRLSDEMKALDSCISISRRRNIINLYCLAALYKKIEYLFNVGDYVNCINYSTECEMLAKQYAHSRGKREYDAGMQYAYTSLIWNVLAQISLNNFQVADSLLHNKLDESKRTGYAVDLTFVYEQMARVQSGFGNFKKAITYYNKALVLEKKAGRVISCKTILNNIGYCVLGKYNDPDQALYYYRQALALVNKDETQAELNSVETLNILCNVGNVFVKKGYYDSAFTYFQFALDQIKPGMNESELLHSHFEQFAKLKKIDYIIALLLDKADAYLKQYNEGKNSYGIREAVRIYKVTDQLLDRVKTEQSDMHSMLFWRSDSRRLYEHAIEACYADNNTEDAFYFFEKSRSALLNDQLNEQRWSGEEDIQKQTQLKKNIQQLVKKSDGLDGNSERYKHVQEELFNSRYELEHLIRRIKERDPFYYQSFIDLKVTSMQDVRKNILSDHQGLVEIFSGDSAVYLFSISSGREVFNKLNKKIFDSLSKVYMAYMSNVSLLNGHFDEFQNVSRILYHLIFPNEKPTPGRIIISPDGQYFPFEALVTSNAGQPLKYFSDEFAVSYTYSAKYLLNPFSGRAESKSHDFLGVAPVIYPGYMQLASLKGSDLSVSHIKSYFQNASSQVFTDATKDRFMNGYSKYKIIQLYTHAAASGKNGEPVVYFSDSALYLSDLLGEDKPATRLIVLSACESGAGQVFKGEGVFSLNRGFAALGIPSSVSNLWSVDDKSTYRLTELFYKYLAKNMPMDLALQKAKLEFLSTASKDHQMPYYWAASILIGRSDALEIEKTGAWARILMDILILGILALLVYAGIHFSKRRSLRS